MIKKLVNWFIMRKVRNAAGEMEANGISKSKVCAVVLGLMFAVEYASPYFGHPILISTEIKGFIAAIGGIAMKEGIDRSAPAK